MASIALKKKINMTYADKIRAIRAEITIFGGTLISLADSNVIIGFGARGVHGTGYFMLRDITADEKIVGINDDGVEITIPIHWLSENYLCTIFVHYYNACKEQLTESAMKEIDEIIKE